MLIEELIRLGRPVLESGLDARDILRLITDAADDRVKNFYRHVIVVELPPEGAVGEPVVLDVQNWQIEQQVAGKKKPEIDVDEERTVGVPVSLPAGGNPLHPQGRYGLPVYPVYDPHFQAFRESAKGVREFLDGRLERTPGFSLDDGLLDQIAACLHTVVAERCAGPEKRLGVLVLARCEPGGFFTYGDRNSRTNVGQSLLSPGRYLEPDCARIAEALWVARVEEGAAMGRRAGPCSLTGEGESAVAAYSKAWPWAFATWTCPVPHGGDTDLLVEGIALSEASYRALTLGANLFHGLTKTLDRVVLPELFAPVENRDRQNAARSRKFTDLPAIYGSAFLLPVRDAILAEPLDRDSFARVVLAMVNAPEPSGPLADRYLTAVTGFNAPLPDELNSNDFRLTLVYFSGDVSRGDVHLRAYIQDVLPSTVGDLKRTVRPCREQMAELMRLLSPNASERHLAYLATCYQSVPYLLARAYGGSSLWSALEQCLHRRPLDDGPLVSHVAARIRSVVPRWPDSRFEVVDEVIFLLVNWDFIQRYNREVAKPPKEDLMPMRPWRKLLEMLEKQPPTEMTFDPENVAELGFACGALIRRFSAWYWRATKVGREGKDYLKHRVLTFGTDLSPAVVWRVGLGKLCDVAARYETKDRRLGRTFRERLGILLTELEQRKEKVKACPDEFMTAFWAGYCLQGYDRPSKPKIAAAGTKGGEQ
jgi:hypothetical protein